MPGSIIINPSVFTDKRDAFAVAVNEALRLWMEDYEFTPEFDITPEQEAFFKDTAYAGDMVAMSKTILARIATRDTSIPRPSPEQIEETSRLLDGVMDTAGLSMADFMLASQMQEALFYDHSPTSEEEEMPDAPEGTGSTTSAMGGGDVAVEPNSPPDMVESVYAMHENTPIVRTDFGALADSQVIPDTELAELKEEFQKRYGGTLQENAEESGMYREVPSSENGYTPAPVMLVEKGTPVTYGVVGHEFGHWADPDVDKKDDAEMVAMLSGMVAVNNQADARTSDELVRMATPDMTPGSREYARQAALFDWIKEFGPALPPKASATEITRALSQWTSELRESEDGELPKKYDRLMNTLREAMDYDRYGDVDQVDDNYNTLLGDAEFDDFLAWKKENAPRDSGEDYDLPGAYRAGIHTGGDGHMPDTFKKPNHPTFSQDSRYSTEDTPGGVWGEDDSGKPTYTPSRWMEQDSARMLDLRDYMATFEPGVKLVFPKHPKRSRARRNEEEPMAEEE